LEGDRIADLRSHTGSLVSVYAARPSPGGYAALLSELLKPIRERADGMDRSVQKSVRNDAERIHALADRFEVEPTPGYAIFASDFDGIFALERLGHTVPNVSAIGPRPYLRPLRASPRPLRSSLLVADRSVARTFTAVEGIVEEIGDPIGADVGNRSWGGFSGYDEQTVRSRAEEMTVRVWREAGERLLDRHVRRPFDYIAIGSHEEMVEEIARTLHPYLARLPRASFVASPQTVGIPMLRAEVGALNGRILHEQQSELAERVCDTAWSGGNAVLGLQEVLDAANIQAIDTLVVAGEFTKPGVLCDVCGRLAREGVTCPVCGATMFEIDDIVAAVMEAGVAAGGTVTQVSVASPLDRSGVGALTRFPVVALV
jgi:hypothetical protein